MKTTRGLITLCVLAGLSALAQAQSVPKIKDGDKLAVDFSTYDTRGREVYVAKVDKIDSSVSMQEKTYTWTSPLSTTIYQRGTHTITDRAPPGGAMQEVPEKQRFSWFPAGGDFSKVQSGSVGIHNQRCGEGTFKYEAASAPVKFKISIAGQALELNGQEVTFKGKWTNTCGTGDQVIRYVYSPDLDYVVERDLKVFQPNAILSTGNNVKVTAVN
ncbi:hypothetical protein [Variovorax sp. PCZ-1]|uniref:hypothetical protein n=1 Tax=Variovorax sp. PCZ-1 TaxID=2835533 RepID=UPI001BD11065|nr:hypothetical protein [Variovorax sp. PCZ-1]MBS7808178.1 hypothetical protein [Variovorax sp. PCZ-1]